MRGQLVAGGLWLVGTARGAVSRQQSEKEGRQEGVGWKLAQPGFLSRLGPPPFPLPTNHFPLPQSALDPSTIHTPQVRPLS